jgi:hypothetical protein
LAKVRAALKTPLVLAFCVGLLAVEFGLIFGLAAGANAIGVHFPIVEVGFLYGAIFATVVLTILAAVAVLSGGVNWITGSVGESWSGEVLESLGPDWTVLHNLKFTDGRRDPPREYDVDHVAVGPHGILVVESKYSTESIDLDAERLSYQIDRSITQVSRNELRIRRLLPTSSGRLPIYPVLIYWGWKVKLPTQPVRPAGRVSIVMGADVKRWRPHFQGNALAPETRKEVLAELTSRAVTLSNQVHDEPKPSR